MKRTKFNKFIWLFPLLYFIHDIEEILTVESFLLTHSDRIPVQITTLEFTLAFLLLWAVAVIGCYFLALKYLLKEQGLTVKRFLIFLVLGFILQAPLAASALLISKVLFT